MQAEIEQGVAQRAEEEIRRLLTESHALQEVAAELASERDFARLLDRIVERTRAVLGADGCFVWLFDEQGRWRIVAAYGLSQTYLGWLTSTPMERIVATFQNLTSPRHPVYSRDLQAAVRPVNPQLADAYLAEGLVSSLRLPLSAADDRVDGALLLYHRQERLYSEEEMRLAQAFANQIAVALHNVRLSEQERAAREAATRQVERMEMLARITQQLLATTELERVLRVVTEAGWRLLNASAGSIALRNADGDGLTLQWVSTSPDFTVAARPPEGFMSTSFPGTPFADAMRTRAVVAAEDLAELPPSLPRDWAVAAGLRAGIAAPLLLDGEPIGVLTVNDVRVRPFPPEDLALVQMLADQAALAIEKARLARRGQDAAVLEERARLARDLHDSVSQSLFSISLISEALPRLLERRPERALEQIQTMSELSKGALTELRNLIFELRPLALMDEGLVAALERYADAYARREQIAVDVDIRGERRLAGPIEEALFRIAQECLNNVSKHARASRVELRLLIADDHVELTVTDDGVGLEAASTPAGRRSLGMTSMRERAMLLGGSCTVQSAAGAGTSVCTRLPLRTTTST